MAGLTDAEKVSKDAVFTAIVKEAGEFYKLIITVASAFLGGSLLFLERIASSATKGSTLFLWIGWFFLVASIVLVAEVRRRNLQAGELALRNKYEEGEAYERGSKKLTTSAIVSLGIGLSSLVLFGLFNLPNSEKELSMSEKSQDVEKAVEQSPSDKKSIPFSATVSRPPQDDSGGNQQSESGKQGRTPPPEK